MALIGEVRIRSQPRQLRLHPDLDGDLRANIPLAAESKLAMPAVDAGFDDIGLLLNEWLFDSTLPTPSPGLWKARCWVHLGTPSPGSPGNAVVHGARFTLRSGNHSRSLAVPRSSNAGVSAGPGGVAVEGVDNSPLVGGPVTVGSWRGSGLPETPSWRWGWCHGLPPGSTAMPAVPDRATQR